MGSNVEGPCAKTVFHWLSKGTAVHNGYSMYAWVCQTRDVMNINNVKQIHFVEVISTLELIVCPEFDCCDLGLRCSVPAMQKSQSVLFSLHNNEWGVLLCWWLKVHWKLKSCWGCAAASNIVQVWETDRWQECKHLHLSLQLREGFKVWLFVHRGLRLLFEVRCLANFNNWFGLS